MYNPFGPAPKEVQEERRNEIYDEVAALREGMLLDEMPDFERLLKYLDNYDVTEARKECTDLIENLKIRENELIDMENRLANVDA